MDGDGADERELSRVETICQTGKVPMLDNLPILMIIIICYQEKLSFIFVKHGKHEGQIVQFTEQFCGNEKKSPPPKNHVPNMSHWEGKEKGRCVWTK